MVSKFPQMGSSIFSEMSQLAMHYNAINLSQGFPDFPIMSIDSIKELKLLNEELIQQKLIKTNLIFENEFKNSWENFIK